MPTGRADAGGQARAIGRGTLRCDGKRRATFLTKKASLRRSCRRAENACRVVLEVAHVADEQKKYVPTSLPVVAEAEVLVAAARFRVKHVLVIRHR